MHIEIIQDHLSIKRGLIFDLPDFTVLTGSNGSGKTQLLHAMTRTESSKIDDFNNTEIVHADKERFVLADESPQGAQDFGPGRDAMFSAWNDVQTAIPKVTALRESLGEQYQLIEDDLRKNRGSYVDYVRDVRGVDLIEILNGEMAFQNSYLVNIGFQEILKRLPCSPDRVTQLDIYANWPPHPKNRVLPTDLSLRIWNYYIKQVNNDLVGLRQKEGMLSKAQFLSPEEFKGVHGPKPWELMNAFMEKAGLRYKVNSPELVDPFGNYAARLVSDVEPNVEIPFSSLSSGEKTMLALAGILYTNDAKGSFPRLLLLDEVDASLHPSMINGLIQVVEQVLVPQGVKVVLVTHSPSTVALAPEGALYEMKREGEQRIVKVDRRTALSVLTEGFATLDEGVLMFHQAAKHKVSIFTEGFNARIFQTALNLFGLGDRIGIVSGINGITGASQLRTVRDFFANLPHENEVVFLLDCDVRQKFDSENKTHWIVIPKNEENKLVESGIENAFDSALFSSFLNTNTDSKGNVRVSFDSKRKGDFADHVVGRNNADDFAWFKGIANQLVALRDT